MPPVPTYSSSAKSKRRLKRLPIPLNSQISWQAKFIRGVNLVQVIFKSSFKLETTSVLASLGFPALPQKFSPLGHLILGPRNNFQGKGDWTSRKQRFMNNAPMELMVLQFLYFLDVPCTSEPPKFRNLCFLEIQSPFPWKLFLGPRIRCPSG